MSFEIKGKLEVIYDETQVTDKFRKREFVLMIQEGQYPEYPKFQLVQDKCNLLDRFKVGDEVIVSFNLRGKPFAKNGITTYYTNLDVWKIVSATGTEAKTTAAASTPSKPTAATTGSASLSNNRSDISGMTFTEAASDELPF